MSKHRIAVFALNLFFLSSIVPGANADSCGKFPGKGSVAAYTKTCDIGNQANECLKKGEFNTAIKLYRQCTSIYPYDSATHQSLGNALRKAGKLDESIVSQKKALELEPTYVSAWVGLALSYEALHKLTDSEQCYRKAVELKPDSYQAVASLGDILRQQGRVSEARVWLQKARTCPNSKNFPGEIDKALKLCDEQEKKSPLKEASK